MQRLCKVSAIFRSNFLRSMYFSRPTEEFLDPIAVEAGFELESVGLGFFSSVGFHSGFDSVTGELGGGFGVLFEPFFTAVNGSMTLNLLLKSASEIMYEGIDLKTPFLYLLKISV